MEKLHFIKGNCYIELKDYANAVLELQAAVRLQGAGTESYRSLAIALANDGKLEEAQQELDTLQKKGASSGDCDLVAAEILSLQKNYDQALALYTKVFNEAMAQIRREYLCLPDRFFCGWNRWHDRFGCCGSRFSMDPAQAGKKAEGTDLERVSIKINRLRGMKKC